METIKTILQGLLVLSALFGGLILGAEDGPLAKAVDESGDWKLGEKVEKVLAKAID